MTVYGFFFVYRGNPHRSQVQINLTYRIFSKSTMLTVKKTIKLSCKLSDEKTRDVKILVVVVFLVDNNFLAQKILIINLRVTTGNRC